MTVRALVAAAIRLFAFYSVVFVFQALTAIHALRHDYWSVWIVAVAVLVEGMVFVALWSFSSAIAKRLVPEPDGSSLALLDAQGLLRAGACLIGLSLVATVVPDAIRWIALDSSPLGDGDEVRIRIGYSILFAKAAIAGILLLGNDAIARLCLSQARQRTDEDLTPTSET